MSRRFTGRKRVRRRTHWATGLSAWVEEIGLSPLNGVTGGTYFAAINFTNGAVLAAEGGEGMVVSRLVGSFTPHATTTVVDGDSFSRLVCLRWAFIRLTTVAAGAIAIPDLFNNDDLGGEDIMYMREHILLPLVNNASDETSGGGIYPDDRRATQAGANSEIIPRARFAQLEFDVTAKRRVDDNQSVQLVIEARQAGGYGPPDPERIDLQFSAWIRMLTLHALR